MSFLSWSRFSEPLSFNYLAGIERDGVEDDYPSLISAPLTVALHLDGGVVVRDDPKEIPLAAKLSRHLHCLLIDFLT